MKFPNLKFQISNFKFLVPLLALLLFAAVAGAQITVMVDTNGNIVYPSQLSLGSNIAAGTLPISALSMSNSPASNLFLRGDGYWAVQPTNAISSNSIVSSLGFDPANGSNIWAGTIPVAKMYAGGTPDSNTFLRGDGYWGAATMTSNNVVNALGYDPANGASLWAGSLPVTKLNAGGSPASNTFLAGDGFWRVPSPTITSNNVVNALGYDPANGASLWSGSVSVLKVNATGTPTSNTFLRGDGAWTTGPASASNAMIWPGGTSVVSFVIGAGLLVNTNGSDMTLSTNGAAGGGSSPASNTVIWPNGTSTVSVLIGAGLLVNTNGSDMTLSTNGAAGGGSMASNAVIWPNGTSTVSVLIGAGLLVNTNGSDMTLSTNGAAGGGGGTTVTNILSSVDSSTGSVALAIGAGLFTTTNSGVVTVSTNGGGGGGGVSGDITVSAVTITNGSDALLTFSPAAGGYSWGLRANGGDETFYLLHGGGYGWSVDSTNGFYVVGDFGCGGTKNFQIPHPLGSPDVLKAGRWLKHASVEAPRPDLLYRGRAQLINGRAVVDLDAASGMTPGTFVALVDTANADVFIMPGDATAVLNGATLTITAGRDPTARVAWLVIATRKGLNFQVESARPALKLPPLLNPKKHPIR